MWSTRVCVLFLASVLTAVLGACGTGGQYFVAKNEPWRAAEEESCLASGVVRETASIHTHPDALGGPSACGAEHPFEMAAADGGRVLIKPVALLRCPMIPQVDHWVAGVVQPAAHRIYGMPLVEVQIAGSYSCRPMNNVSGGILSEHGHANAIDVSAFVFADGSRVSVKSGWHAGGRERAFLQAAHDGACGQFTTVLSPDYDANHRDHFHLDLARRGPTGLGTVCK
jgi:hypothetical protein